MHLRKDICITSSYIERCKSVANEYKYSFSVFLKKIYFRFEHISDIVVLRVYKSFVKFELKFREVCDVMSRTLVFYTPLHCLINCRSRLCHRTVLICLLYKI